MHQGQIILEGGLHLAIEDVALRVLVEALHQVVHAQELRLIAGLVQDVGGDAMGEHLGKHVLHVRQGGGDGRADFVQGFLGQQHAAMLGIAGLLDGVEGSHAAIAIGNLTPDFIAGGDQLPVVGRVLGQIVGQIHKVAVLQALENAAVIVVAAHDDIRQLLAQEQQVHRFLHAGGSGMDEIDVDARGLFHFLEEGSLVVIGHVVGDGVGAVHRQGYVLALGVDGVARRHSASAQAQRQHGQQQRGQFAFHGWFLLIECYFGERYLITL